MGRVQQIFGESLLHVYKICQYPDEICTADLPPVVEICQILPGRDIVIQIFPAVDRTPAAGQKPFDPVCRQHLVLIILLQFGRALQNHVVVCSITVKRNLSVFIHCLSPPVTSAQPSSVLSICRTGRQVHDPADTSVIPRRITFPGIFLYAENPLPVFSEKIQSEKRRSHSCIYFHADLCA